MKMKESNDKLIRMAMEYVKVAQEDAETNPTSDSIQVVVVEPSKKPYKKIIPNKLESMNALVGGYIEIIRIGYTETGGSIAITLNEEGKLMNLPFNKVVHWLGGSDVLVGTFFITAFNMQGDNITLSDSECEKIIKKFKGTEVYF